MDLTSAFVLLFVIWSYNNYLHNITKTIINENKSYYRKKYFFCKIRLRYHNYLIKKI